MALSDSDRALLQLLTEGGQDYAQAGALLGVDASEAALRSQGALSSLTPAEPPLPPAVSDWLLGQADPISQADAVAAIRQDESLRRQAVATASAMKLVFPSVEVPEVPSSVESGPTQKIPAPSATPPPPASTAPQTPSSTGMGGPHGSGGAYRALPTSEPKEPLASRVSGRVGGLSAVLRKNPRAAVVGGALSVLVIAVVLGVTLLGGRDSQKETGSNGTATLVPLEPVSNGSAASGQAVVVAANGAAIAQVQIAGLEPTTADQSYVLWLYRNPEQAYPLARDVVGKTGKLSGPAPVPRGLEPPYSSYGCLELTLASKTEIEAGLKRVAKSGTGPAVGESVLRGEIAPASRDPRSGPASVCDPDARD